jgi:ubiquinone/menaquinone biosynthesis C-methylase UbiE
MNRKIQADFQVFNRDVTQNYGYLYSTNAQLSSQIANCRLTDATLAIIDLLGKRLLDIGCGDGTYTVEIFDRGQPASIHGVDVASEAISIAQQKIRDRSMTFAVHSAYELPYAANTFDVAYLRGVLHHLDRPIDALREALRVAAMLVVIEPNGYSPVLKLLERYSRYHVEHQEKSYTANVLDQWIGQNGGIVLKRQWVGLVPMFCPAWFARMLKWIEPVVERTPLLNRFGCAVYVFIATRKNS